MQKVFNISVVLAIIGLGIAAFMLWRKLNNIGTLIATLTPAPPVTAPITRRDVTAGEFWDAFKKTADKVIIEMDIKQ